ncbi:MAG TPA: hypothetical protein VGS27_07285 [Candidatus Sulfotelmatobacter sp.]|nr:hypothetical protein [Candidatus Sulfotelmatobacter sp.]
MNSGDSAPMTSQRKSELQSSRRTRRTIGWNYNFMEGAANLFIDDHKIPLRVQDYIVNLSRIKWIAD